MIVALQSGANCNTTLAIYFYMSIQDFFLFLSLSPAHICTVVMLRSMYEYTAQDVEELSFPEGAMIRLMRTDENGVDDGWWEGSYEGKVGVFPSVVVEVVSGDVNLFNQVSLCGVFASSLTMSLCDSTMSRPYMSFFLSTQCITFFGIFEYLKLIGSCRCKW